MSSLLHESDARTWSAVFKPFLDSTSPTPAQGPARFHLATQGAASEIAMAFRAVALALALGAASAGPGGGTYPPGVSYNKLTAETFNDFVEGAIADGKTAMVRWIASEG